jgi:hypothetical protein
MSKLCRLDPKYWPLEDFGYWCPGCNCGHEIAVTKKNASNASWTFNGNFQRPTFSPSLNLKINTPDMGARYQPDIASTVCHCFIRDGRIEFLADCTHALRGQTVDLPDIPPGKYLSCERL